MHQGQTGRLLSPRPFLHGPLGYPLLCFCPQFEPWRKVSWKASLWMMSILLIGTEAPYTAQLLHTVQLTKLSGWSSLPHCPRSSNRYFLIRRRTPKPNCTCIHLSSDSSVVSLFLLTPVKCKQQLPSPPRRNHIRRNKDSKRQENEPAIRHRGHNVTSCNQTPILTTHHSDKTTML